MVFILLLLPSFVISGFKVDETGSIFIMHLLYNEVDFNITFLAKTLDLSAQVDGN